MERNDRIPLVGGQEYDYLTTQGRKWHQGPAKDAKRTYNRRKRQLVRDEIMDEEYVASLEAEVARLRDEVASLEERIEELKEEWWDEQQANNPGDWR